ncbi:hypothetical protein SUGI_0830200 [Cryptomeria japonica]|nr:hypothetical protein SUGI_0830200 [Cryptomeria japonica]
MALNSPARIPLNSPARLPGFDVGVSAPVSYVNVVSVDGGCRRESGVGPRATCSGDVVRGDSGEGGKSFARPSFYVVTARASGPVTLRRGGRGFVPVSCVVSVKLNRETELEIDYNEKVFSMHSVICRFRGF